MFQQALIYAGKHGEQTQVEQAVGLHITGTGWLRETASCESGRSGFDQWCVWTWAWTREDDHCTTAQRVKTVKPTTGCFMMTHLDHFVTTESLSLHQNVTYLWVLMFDERRFKDLRLALASLKRHQGLRELAPKQPLRWTHHWLANLCDQILVGPDVRLHGLNLTSLWCKQTAA